MFVNFKLNNSNSIWRFKPSMKYRVTYEDGCSSKKSKPHYELFFCDFGFSNRICPVMEAAFLIIEASL